MSNQSNVESFRETQKDGKYDEISDNELGLCIVLVIALVVMLIIYLAYQQLKKILPK